MSTGRKIGNWKQAAKDFWSERNHRERMMLAVAAIVIVVGLFYILLIDPARSGRASLGKKLPALREQAAQMQALTKEAASSAAKPATTVPQLTHESLEASLTGRGFKPTNVTFTGELAKLQLTAVSFANLVDWLSEMQRNARLSVVDATVEAQAQIDTVNATLTLRQQKGE